MIEVFPCCRDDLYEIESLAPLVDQEMTLVQIEATPGVDELLKTFARTLRKDGRAIASFGVWPMWQGVARAWSELSQESLNMPKTLHKTVTECLDGICQEYGLKRVEAVVYHGHDAGHRWLEHLGFEHECLMRNYGVGGDADCDLYARIMG